MRPDGVGYPSPYRHYLWTTGWLVLAATCDQQRVDAPDDPVRFYQLVPLYGFVLFAVGLFYEIFFTAQIRGPVCG